MEEKMDTTPLADTTSRTDLSFDHSHNDSKVFYLLLARNLMMKTVPPIILVFGTFGNIMIIALFSRRSSVSSLNLYFNALAASDLCLLYTGLFTLWVEFTFGFNLPDTHTLVCKLMGMVAYTTGVVSVWLVVAMTGQRAASVIWPHKVNLMCTHKKAKLYIIVMTIIFVAINSHFLYGLSLNSSGNVTETCRRNTVVPEYKFFVHKIWPWIDIMMYSLLPFVILIVSNSVLVWKVTNSVRKARVTLASSQSDQLTSRTKTVSSITVTLIVVSVTFFLLSAPLSLFYIILPYTIPYSNLTQDQWNMLFFVDMLLNLLWYSNSAVNFYLYCLTGTTFRTDVWNMFCSKQNKGIGDKLSSNTQISVTEPANATETEF